MRRCRVDFHIGSVAQDASIGSTLGLTKNQRTAKELMHTFFGMFDILVTEKIIEYLVSPGLTRGNSQLESDK